MSCKIAWTLASPGLSELAYSTAALLASRAGAPTIHCWYTSATRAAWPAALVTGLAHSAGNPCRDRSALDPVYRRQLLALLSSPGWTTCPPFWLIAVAPAMMLLIARAATARLSIGLAELYGWCRLSEKATAPPWLGVIGSRPLRPVAASVKAGSSPLVSSAKTHKTLRVSWPQAKLTWPGSEATFGFWHATSICCLTVATLAGHDAPPPGSTTASAMPSTRVTAAATMTLRRVSSGVPARGLAGLRRRSRRFAA